MPKNSSLWVTPLKPFAAAMRFSSPKHPNLNHLRTAGTNQMMIMAVVPFPDQFKPRRAIAEIETLDHPQLLQQMHGAINRRQIAPAPGHGRKNFPVREGMRMLPQNFQDGRPRAGDPAGLPAQAVCQRGHFRPPRRMLVRGISSGPQMKIENQSGDQPETGDEISQYQTFMMFENFPDHRVSCQI